MDNAEVKIKLIITNISEFNEKTDELEELLKKAKSLADELANFEFTVDFKNRD